MKHLDLLGRKVRDIVTNFEGVVTSISYDLYGCIQAIITPQEKEASKGYEEKSRWYDAARLVVLDPEPVMEVPDFEKDKGPESKPTR